MNKNLLIGIVVLVVVFVGYRMFSNKQQTTPAPSTPEVTASPSPSEVVINLAAQNQSSESGTATLAEVNGKVKVTLKLTGAPAGVAQPAHIHAGACPNVGAVKYPLTFPVDGMSETVLDVTLAELKSQLPLGVNVHKSAAEAKIYVSCGDLVL